MTAFEFFISLGAMKSRTVLFMVCLFTGAMAFCQQDSVNRMDAAGHKQGKWIGYYDDGSKRYEGTFRDDKPLGIFTYFDKNGFVNMLMYHKKDGKTTVANAYHPNGRIMAMGLYREQKKDSVWQYYNEREALVSTETYRKGVKDGIERAYYPDGQLAKVLNWKNGKKEGPVKEFFQDGEIKYKGNYVNDKLEGEVVYNYPNGRKKVVGHYLNNLRDGLWKEYYKDGLPKAQRLYAKGKLLKTQIDNAPYKEYYNSRRVREEGKYVNAKKNGPYTVYYDLGERKLKYVEPDPSKAEVGGYIETVEGQKIKIKGNYKDGKLDGRQVYYTPEGKVEKVEIYRDGALIQSK